MTFIRIIYIRNCKTKNIKMISDSPSNCLELFPNFRVITVGFAWKCCPCESNKVFPHISAAWVLQCSPLYTRPGTQLNNISLIMKCFCVVLQFTSCFFPKMLEVEKMKEAHMRRSKGAASCSLTVCVKKRPNKLKKSPLLCCPHSFRTIISCSQA